MIGVSDGRAKALTAAGKPLPAPEVVWGLIDTGAQCTALDLAVIKKLGLEPTGSTMLHTPSTGSSAHAVSLYDISLYLYDHADRYFVNRPIAVTGNDLSNCGCEMLIGEDVLKHCLFIYDGRAKAFTLAF